MPLKNIGFSLLLVVLLSGCQDRTKEASVETDEENPRHTDFNGDPNSIIPHISAEIHPNIETVLIVRWTQTKETRTTRIRYTFENDDWLATPALPRSAGEHQEVLLGTPEETDVTFFFETDLPEQASAAFDAGTPDGGETPPKRFTATTGALPSNIPRPTVLDYSPALSSDAEWMLGSVEATAAMERYYVGPFWLYIMDRQGRIVWYYSDQSENPCMAYPRISRDNSHIYIEKRTFFHREGYRPKVARMTLDLDQFEEIFAPGLDDCIDVTDDGGILFNEWDEEKTPYLKELRPDGTVRNIWNCALWAADIGVGDKHNYCYSNTVNWNPVGNTVILSMPYINTAVEIDRTTGTVVSQWGNASESWAFSPSTWAFQFNHFPNITPEGTLLISTHTPDYVKGKGVQEHRFVEFEIDRTSKRLVEKWSYGAAVDEWPQYKGEAVRLQNGNTLVNFGTGGVIQEVTPNKEIAWHVKFDADFNDDHFNRMVGHSIMLNELYPLCNGW